mmetsp:Transcript_112971/g.319510  ORF Transcript_112971/g.319510 Transcript_112971/m.319510 type:complete len:1505 (+) Transcript_112971:49-4563(+)
MFMPWHHKQEIQTAARSDVEKSTGRASENGLQTPHSSWSKAVHDVDSKQAELHGMQWHIVRDHMSTLNRGHDLLQEKHAQHRAAHIALHSRVDDLEQVKAALKLDHERFSSAQAKLLARIENLEQRQGTLQHEQEVATNQANSLSKKLGEWERQHATFKTEHERFCTSTRTNQDKIDSKVAELERIVAEGKGTIDHEVSSVKDALEQNRRTRDVALEQSLTKLDELQARFDKRFNEQSLALEKLQREYADVAVGLEKEQAARTMAHEQVNDVVDLRCKGVEDRFHSAISNESQARATDIANLRHILDSDRGAREESHRSMKDLFEAERMAREAHGQRVEGHLDERLEAHSKRMQAEVDAHEKRVQGHLNGHEELLHGELSRHEDRLHGRIVEHGEMVVRDLSAKLSDAIKEEAMARQGEMHDVHQTIHGDRLARTEHHEALRETVAHEKVAREAHETWVRGNFDEHEQKLLAEVADHARNTLENQRAELQDFRSSIQERIEHLEAFLQESASRHDSASLKDIVDRAAQTLREAVANESSVRQAEVSELRELIGGESLARSEHHTSLRELLLIETAAREAHAEEMRHHLSDQEEKMLGIMGQQKGDTKSMFQETVSELEQSLRSEVAGEANARRSDVDALREEVLETAKWARASHEEAVRTQLERHEASQQAAREAHEVVQVAHADTLDALERRLREELAKETSTREADVYDLRDIIGGEQLARTEHFNNVQELFANEKQARQAHEGEWQSKVGDSHGRLATLHNSLKHRVELLENFLQGPIDNQEQGSFVGTLFKLEERLRCEIAQETDLREAEVNALRSSCAERFNDIEENLERERTAREPFEDALEREKACRVAHEETIKDHLAKHAMRTRSECENMLNDFVTSLPDRVGSLEAFLHGSDDGTDQPTLKGILGRLENSIYEELGKEAHAREAGEERSRDFTIGKVDEIRSQVENSLGTYKSMLGEQINRCPGQCTDVDGRLAQVESFLRNATDGQGVGTLRDLLMLLDQRLRSEIAEEAGSREADVLDLRELLGSETLARAEHHTALKELIANEKVAREDHETKVFGQQSKGYNGTCEYLLQEHHARLNENQEREACLQKRVAFLEEFLQQRSNQLGHKTLKESLDHLEQRLHDAVAGEVARREADMSDFREILSSEQVARADMGQHLQELIVREKAARNEHESRVHDQLKSEKEALEASTRNEAAKHSETLKNFQDAQQEHESAVTEAIAAFGEELNTIGSTMRGEQDRFKALKAEVEDEVGKSAAMQKDVDALKEMLNNLGANFRLEQEASKAETKSLWDAIDTHTHDMRSGTKTMETTDRPVPNRFAFEQVAPVKAAQLVKQQVLVDAPATTSPVRTPLSQPPTGQPSPLTQPPSTITSRPVLTWSNSAVSVIAPTTTRSPPMATYRPTQSVNVLPPTRVSLSPKSITRVSVTTNSSEGSPKAARSPRTSPQPEHKTKTTVQAPMGPSGLARYEKKPQTAHVDLSNPFKVNAGSGQTVS